MRAPAGNPRPMGPARCRHADAALCTSVVDKSALREGLQTTNLDATPPGHEPAREGTSDDRDSARVDDAQSCRKRFDQPPSRRFWGATQGPRVLECSHPKGSGAEPANSRSSRTIAPTRLFTLTCALWSPNAIVRLRAAARACAASQNAHRTAPSWSERRSIIK